jgi:hypothetical protein
MERGVTDRRLIKVAMADFVEGRSFLILFTGRGAEGSAVLSSSVAAEVGDVNICLNAYEIIEDIYIVDGDTPIPSPVACSGTDLVQRRRHMSCILHTEISARNVR